VIKQPARHRPRAPARQIATASSRTCSATPSNATSASWALTSSAERATSPAPAPRVDDRDRSFENRIMPIATTVSPPIWAQWRPRAAGAARRTLRNDLLRLTCPEHCQCVIDARPAADEDGLTEADVRLDDHVGFGVGREPSRCGTCRTTPGTATRAPPDGMTIPGTRCTGPRRTPSPPTSADGHEEQRLCCC
jgi:hypothetical protein